MNRPLIGTATSQAGAQSPDPAVPALRKGGHPTSEAETRGSVLPAAETCDFQKVIDFVVSPGWPCCAVRVQPSSSIVSHGRRTSSLRASASRSTLRRFTPSSPVM